MIQGPLALRNFFVMQVDQVYLSSPNVIAVLDHEKKQTFVIVKDGLPDVGKMFTLVENCFDALP